MSAAPWWCRCLALLKRKYIWSQCTVIQLREYVDINWNTESTVQLINRLLDYFVWCLVLLCPRYCILNYSFMNYLGSFIT